MFRMTRLFGQKICCTHFCHTFKTQMLFSVTDTRKWNHCEFCETFYTLVSVMSAASTTFQAEDFEKHQKSVVAHVVVRCSFSHAPLIFRELPLQQMLNSSSIVSRDGCLSVDGRGVVNHGAEASPFLTVCTTMSEEQVTMMPSWPVHPQRAICAHRCLSFYKFFDYL